MDARADDGRPGSRTGRDLTTGKRSGSSRAAAWMRRIDSRGSPWARPCRCGDPVHRRCASGHRPGHPNGRTVTMAGPRRCHRACDRSNRWSSRPEASNEDPTANGCRNARRRFSRGRSRLEPATRGSCASPCCRHGRAGNPVSGSRRRNAASFRIASADTGRNGARCGGSVATTIRLSEDDGHRACRHQSRAERQSRVL